MLKDKEQIIQWLEIQRVKDYTINKDFTVDVNRGVFLQAKEITHIPVQFGMVNGDFICAHNNLNTLRGMPYYIKGGLDMAYNKELCSLEFCPKSIGKNISLYSTGITSLEPLHGTEFKFVVMTPEQASLIPETSIAKLDRVNVFSAEPFFTVKYEDLNKFYLNKNLTQDLVERTDIKKIKL